MKYFRRMTGRLGLLVLAGFAGLLTGCAIPRQEFQVYQDSFKQAKTAAEDVILQTKNRAEAFAESPFNSKLPDERKKDLADRMAALDTRLSALELIDRYNSVLVSLASGTDPEAVAGNIQGFADSLSSFGMGKLTSLVADASPYTAVIANAISIIDDLIKKQKFKQAVAAGKAPVIGILQVLQQDAEKIHTIEAAWISLRAESERKQLNALKFNFQKLIDNHATNDLDEVLTSYAAVVSSIQNPRLATGFMVKHTPGPSPATANDLAILGGVLDQVRTHTERYNKHMQEIQAHAVMIKNYEGILKATGAALENLHAAIRDGRQAAMLDFVAQALEFRRSILAFTNTQLN